MLIIFKSNWLIFMSINVFFCSFEAFKQETHQIELKLERLILLFAQNQSTHSINELSVVLYVYNRRLCIFSSLK